MSEAFNSQALIALLTLTALEIVLGIDNIIFISILASKLPGKQAVRPARLALRLPWGRASCCSCPWRGSSG
jgi:predicted tellurium resistance membrane protein TerC